MKRTLGAAGFFVAIAFVHAVDIPWTILEFISGMAMVKPVEELNGVSTNKAMRAYRILVISFIHATINRHYKKISNGINETQTTASEFTDRLINETSKDFDYDLKTLNKIALEAIALLPSNAKSKTTRPELLELPLALGPLNVDETPKTTQVLMMHFPEVIHEDIAAFRNLTDQVFMAGWNQARHFFEVDQMSMRKRYSDKVIAYLIRRFDDVEEHSESIRDKVSTETWAEFLRICNELAAAQDSPDTLRTHYG